MIEDYIVILKRGRMILKSLRMSPNGRISTKANHCLRFIHGEFEMKKESKGEQMAKK